MGIFMDSKYSLLNEAKKLHKNLHELDKSLRLILANEADAPISRDEELILRQTNFPNRDLYLANLARHIYQGRRLREQDAPAPGLFHDPAWDILLDLFQSHASGQRIPIKAAVVAGNVPSTTALRHVWQLEQVGLVARMPDPADARRQFLQLTATGVDYMRKVLGVFADWPQ